MGSVYLHYACIVRYYIPYFVKTSCLLPLQCFLLNCLFVFLLSHFFLRTIFLPRLNLLLVFHILTGHPYFAWMSFFYFLWLMYICFSIQPCILTVLTCTQCKQTKRAHQHTHTEALAQTYSWAFNQARLPRDQSTSHPSYNMRHSRITP